MKPMQRDAVREQLAAAQARLIVEKPFLGVLLLHLPLEAAGWCLSVATDARRIYYNPDYIGRLDARQTQFMLAHQALHCALGHFARRVHRIGSRWDAACDLAVNLLLVEEGFDPAPGALLDPALRGLSAEEIYPLLGETTLLRDFDTHLFEPSGLHRSLGCRANAGEPAERAAAEPDAHTASAAALDSDAAPQARRHRGGAQPDAVALPLGESGAATGELMRRWQIRVAQAAQHARHAGRLSASWQRLLATALEPPLPWRTLLARFLASRAQEDYTFRRPPRRESELLLPRLQSESIELHAVLDTSGSIGETELAAFAAEIDALKGQVRARVTVHACDQELAADGPWTFEPWQPIVLPERVAGAGGTDFRPVFEWLQTKAERPDVLLYFTDGQGEFPSWAPPYPVAWLVKGNAPVPWGERIQFS